jgi:hypothetical protein
MPDGRHKAETQTLIPAIGTGGKRPWSASETPAPADRARLHPGNSGCSRRQIAQFARPHRVADWSETDEHLAQVVGSGTAANVADEPGKYWSICARFQRDGKAGSQAILKQCSTDATSHSMRFELLQQRRVKSSETGSA